MAEIDLGKVIGPQGEKGEQGERGLQGPIGPVGPTGSVDMDTPIEFTEAETLSNIESGESVSTIFGKLKKIAGSLLLGAGSTLLGNNLTAARALVSDVNGKVGVSTVTAAELGYLDGVTKNIQEQFSEQNEKILQVKEYDLTLTYSSANVLRAVLTHGLGVTPKACTIRPWGTTGTIRNFGYVLSNDAPNGQTIQINALSSSKWVSGDELPVKVTLLY